MKLAWAYNCQTKLPRNIQDNITYYFINSINKAKKLGYYTKIYTNSSKFNLIADKVIRVPNNYYTQSWDSFKIFALSHMDNNTTLIDGDVFLHKPLPKLNTQELYFDTFETNNWNLIYKETVDKLTNLNIQEIIPEWENTPQPIINTGLIFFNNIELKTKYLDRWFKFYNFCNKHKNLNLSKLTPVGAQYLLTLLSKGHTIKYFSKKLNEVNDYYVHHSGGAKYKNKIQTKNTLI